MKEKDSNPSLHPFILIRLEVFFLWITKNLRRLFPVFCFIRKKWEKKFFFDMILFFRGVSHFEAYTHIYTHEALKALSTCTHFIYTRECSTSHGKRKSKKNLKSPFAFNWPPKSKWYKAVSRKRAFEKIRKFLRVRIQDRKKDSPLSRERI